VLKSKKGDKNMKTVDHIDTQDKVEKLTEEKKDDYFTDLIMGKDVVEDIETSKGKFVVKYPIAADIVTIGRTAALRRGYKPPECFDAETEMINVVASTLDVVVVSDPPWYEAAKTRNKNFSFLEVPSKAFFLELYSKAYSFRGEVEVRINPPEKPTDKPVPAEESNDDPVGGNTFKGLSSESVNKET
jgi:hypothetical protein